MASVTAQCAGLRGVPLPVSPFGSLKRTRRFFDVLASIVVLVVVTFAIGPIVWTVLTSFKTENEIVSRDFPSCRPR